MRAPEPANDDEPDGQHVSTTTSEGQQVSSSGECRSKFITPFLSSVLNLGIIVSLCLLPGLLFSLCY